MTRRRIVTLLGALAIVAVLGATYAQGARADALAGTIIPGRDLDASNPAALAIPATASGTEIRLPIGLLHYLVSPWADPFGPDVDYYAILNQLTQLEAFLLVVPRSPETWTVTFAGGRPSFDASGGADVRIPDRFGLARSFELPLRFSVAPAFQVGVRPYIDLRVGNTLRTDLLTEGDTLTLVGDFTLQGVAEAGVAVEVAYATALPAEMVPDLRDAYFGTRAHLLVGLVHASVRADGRVSAAIDLDAEFATDLVVEYDGDLLLAGLIQGGVGFGVAVDLGFIGTLESDFGDVSVALAVERLGATWWRGEETPISDDPDADGTPFPARRTQTAPIGGSLAVALRVTPRTFATLGWELSLPEIIDPVIAANVAVVAGGGVRGSVGTEIGIADVSVRAGAGYDAGWRFGVGLGYDAGPAGLDLALSARQAPFASSFGLGIGLSLRVQTGRR